MPEFPPGKLEFAPDVLNFKPAPALKPRHKVRAGRYQQT